MSLEIITIVGMLAVFFQAIRVIPQVIKGFITKSVKDVSVGWLITGNIGAVLWIIYGVLIESYPIIIGNVVNVISYGLIIFQKKIY